MCYDAIVALKLCHEQGGFRARLLGTCNEQKKMLDKCLRAQKKVKVKASLQNARAERERFRKMCEGVEPT